MKLTNGELFGSKEAFGRLLVQDLPVKYSFPIVKLVKKLNDDFAAIEEQRNGLIQKYGEAIDGQVTVQPNGKNFGKFVVEFNELMQMESGVEFDKILIPDHITISGKDLAALEPFIDIVTI